MGTVFFKLLSALGARRILPWLGFVIAVACALPIGWRAYDDVVEVNLKARVRLIQEHRLWEVQADFRGRPEMWTRVASRLLSDGQLLRRVAVKYGAAAEQIELEYRRDLAIARTEVVASWFVIWAGPLAALYAIVVLAQHRRSAPPPAPRTQPASVSDPRYLPPRNSA